MDSLETNRLIIRNFGPNDWQDLQEVAVAYQASEWAKYEDPWPTETEKVKGMAEWFAKGDDYLAVCLKATNKLIGLIAVNRRNEQEQQVHNLGYVFHPGHFGQGYATEGCQAAMRYLFKQLAADGIVTGTHPDNEPSAKLLKRLGLKEMDRGEYAISREEWLAFNQEIDQRDISTKPGSITYQSSVVFIQDIAASRHFYENLLGQEIEMDFGPNVGFKSGFALWQVDHAFQMIHERAPDSTEKLGRQNYELYFETADLEAASSRLTEAGVEFVHSLREQPWGQRAFRVYDPDGHIVELGEPMPTVIMRLLGEGMPAKAVAKRTAMPIEFVKQIADG